MYRLCELHFHNIDASVESVISTFDNQSLSHKWESDFTLGEMRARVLGILGKRQGGVLFYPVFKLKIHEKVRF